MLSAAEHSTANNIAVIAISLGETSVVFLYNVSFLCIDDFAIKKYFCSPEKEAAPVFNV